MLEIYGFWGGVRLCVDYLKTRIFNRTSRIIRRPIYIRGNKYIDWGVGLTTGVNLRIDVFALEKKKEKILFFGHNCQLNDYVHIGATSSVKIGDNVLIASRVFITDHNHGDFLTDPQIDLPPSLRKLSSSPVRIDNNVWLGEGVVILPGVCIGENSIVGAGSVVTKSIPPNSIAVGVPASVIKEYNSSLNRWVSVQ